MNEHVDILYLWICPRNFGYKRPIRLLYNAHSIFENLCFYEWGMKNGCFGFAYKKPILFSAGSAHLIALVLKPLIEKPKLFL